MATWDCICEACGHEWRDVFPETEEGVMCPECDAEDFDAVRVTEPDLLPEEGA